MEGNIYNKDILLYIYFLTIFSIVNMINLLWKAVCVWIFHIFYKESWQLYLCSCEPFTDILVTFRSVCMCIQNKRNILRLVNVHYSSVVHMASLPTHWWQGCRGESHLLAFTAALFCPCLLVKCPAVFHSCLSDVLKGRGGTASRAALHQGLLTAVWREGTISGTKGKHTYLVWDKGCPGQLGEGLNSPFVCMQLEDH